MSHDSVRGRTIRGGGPVRYVAPDVHQRYCEGAELVCRKLRRFRSPKKICGYAGLVPRVHWPGQTHYTGHITKAGRSTLRWILVQVAHRAVKAPGPLRQSYLRLKAKKGTKVATVAVARKLLVLVWTLLTREERGVPRAEPPLRRQSPQDGATGASVRGRENERKGGCARDTPC